MSTIAKTQLSNGMIVLTEPISTVSSAALTWMLPIGSARDPQDQDGCATLLSELIFRGTGSMSSREHSDALDRLGVQRSSQAATNHLSLGATMLGDRVSDALPLITAMVTEPALPDDALPPVRSLCLQSLEALEDDPQQQVMLELREKHVPPPFNRHGYGTESVLREIDGETLRRAWLERSVPKGAIFAAAGAIDVDRLTRQLEELLQGWTGSTPEPVESGAAARGQHHITRPTAQVHLAVACDAPTESDPSSMTERVAISVLSGGTSGRLFTEVRAKRSLCYAVGASYRTGRDRSLISIYAGTTPERAQETLDVSVAELRRLSEGAQPDEFHRAVVGLKSQLIRQGESTVARAGALATDQYRIGRPRPLSEIADQVDAVTLEDLNAYLARRDFGELTITSIGPTALRAPGAAEAAAAS